MLPCLPDSEAVAEVMNEGNEQIEAIDLQRPENAVTAELLFEVNTPGNVARD